MAATYQFDAPTTALLLSHRQHLDERGQLLLSQKLAPPPDAEADPVSKVRWVQYAALREFFRLEPAEGEPLALDVGAQKRRTAILDTLTKTILSEASLSGYVTRTAITAKRDAERDLAKREATEEEHYSREEQLRLYAATLRLNGYAVSRTVGDIEVEAQDGTEGTDSILVGHSGGQG